MVDKWEELKKWVEDREKLTVEQYDRMHINRSILSGQCMELQAIKRKISELETKA